LFELFASALLLTELSFDFLLIITAFKRSSNGSQHVFLRLNGPFGSFRTIQKIPRDENTYLIIRCHASRRNGFQTSNTKWGGGFVLSHCSMCSGGKPIQRGVCEEANFGEDIIIEKFRKSRLIKILIYMLQNAKTRVDL